MDAFVIFVTCLPLMLETLPHAGHFAPQTVLRLHRYYGPSRTLRLSADFPVSPVIRAYLARRFATGRRGGRASPGA